MNGDLLMYMRYPQRQPNKQIELVIIGADLSRL